MAGSTPNPSEAGRKRVSGRELRQLGRLAAYARPYRGHALGALLALVVAAAAVLSLGEGLRHLIDGGFGQGKPGALDHAIEAVGLVIVALAVATWFRAYLITWLGERIVADLRREVFAHLTALSPVFFDSARSGELVSRLTADTTQP